MCVFISRYAHALNTITILFVIQHATFSPVMYSSQVAAKREELETGWSGLGSSMFLYDSERISYSL